MLLEIGPREYEPPSLCHTGIEELVGLGAVGAGEAAAAGTAAATAAETAGAFGSWSALAEAGTAASALPSLSTIGTVASVGGTLLQVGAQQQEAAYQQAVAKNQALALKQKANEDAAAAERQQIAQERKMGLVLSRQRAVAASSGTDALSPDIVGNELRTVQQGEYNALSSLYEGLSASRSDQYQADIDLFKARQIGRSLPYAIGGTLLSGISNYADRSARLRYFSSSGGSGFFGTGGI